MTNPPVKPNVSAIKFHPGKPCAVDLEIDWTPERNPEYAHTALITGPDKRVWAIRTELYQPAAIITAHEFVGEPPADS